MGKKTPFYPCHLRANAKIVDFAGWEMPLHYGSQLQEHHQVREHAGMFDVSHMGIVDLQGQSVPAYLRYLLANNIDRLHNGKALYTCLLNEQGGVIDDLIVYKIADDCYRLVINAGTREKDLAWMRKQAAAFTDTEMQIIERTDLAMLAVQGPETQVIIEQLLAKQDVGFSNTLKNAIALHPFTFCYTDDWLIARTGYTGEDGYEIMLPAEQAEAFWQNLLDNGIMPCGLGARDSLRLEAGLNLYGADMDETVTPLEANLTWTVALEPKERDFIGRQALEQQIQQGVQHRLVGLVLTAPGVIRSHQAVFNQDQQIGEVTSGGYSPTLDQSIAFARVTADIGTQCWIEIRNKRLPAQVVKPPFVRQGQKVFCTEQK